MFERGDYIIYGSTGVCLVEDITVPEYFRSAGNEKLYYRLSPVFGTETIYTPVDTTVFMRPVITKEQAEELIRRIPEIEEANFEGKDRRATAENYKISIETHECEDLVRLIKTGYQKNRTLTENGKKPGQTDLQYLRQAETLLHGELSIALGMSVEEVPAYIGKFIASTKSGETE